MASSVKLTYELLAEIAKLSKRKRKIVLTELYASEWDHCADDLIYWLDKSQHAVPYVYTWDPHELYVCNMCNDDQLTQTRYKLYHHLDIRHGLDLDNEKAIRQYFRALPHIRPFTIKEYMLPIIKQAQASQLFAVEKSRDMMMTWLMVAMISWEVFFHSGKQWAVQSRDGKTTLYIMENRVKFIHDNMPPWMRNRHPISWSRSQTKAGYLRIPSLNSEIVGFAAGPDQIRYLHPSGVFVDEGAFQEQAGALFSAVKPAIEEGGKYWSISTPYPSFFQLICEDRTEEEGART